VTERGLTLIELMVALLLLAVSLSGLIGLWAFGFNTTAHSQDIGVAYSVARHEIERGRMIGYLLLPEQSWSTSYDGRGNPTTDPESHYLAIGEVSTIPDANGEINTGCLRTLTVRIRARDREEWIFETVVYLTRGGI